MLPQPPANASCRLASDGRTLEPHADEQRTLSLIREYRGAGLTLRQIADELNRQGCRTRRGSAWKQQDVINLLARDIGRLAA